LLHPVVQVALEASSRGVARLDDALAGGRKLVGGGAECSLSLARSVTSSPTPPTAPSGRAK
jgi:hypothetical protein